jgi:hypothetical protein
MTIGTDVLFSDDFNRANASVTVGAPGAGYTVPGGYDARVISNRVYGYSALGFAYLNDVPTDSANYSVEADVDAFTRYSTSEGYGQFITLNGRYVTDGTAGYSVSITSTDYSSGIQISLISRYSNADHTLGSVYIGTGSLTRITKLGLFMDGSTISAWAAWVDDEDQTDDEGQAEEYSYQQILSYTDAHVTGVGTAGFVVGADGGSLDNFIVTGTEAAEDGPEQIDADDSGSLSISESAAIRAIFGASDTGSLTVSEAITLAATSSVGDSSSISVSESPTVESDAEQIDAADSGSFDISEGTGLAAQVSGSDTGSVDVSESVSALAAVSALADTLGLSLAEAALVFAASSVSDTGVIDASEAVIVAAIIAVSDTGSFSISESADQSEDDDPYDVQEIEVDEAGLLEFEVSEDLPAGSTIVLSVIRVEDDEDVEPLTYEFTTPAGLSAGDTLAISLAEAIAIIVSAATGDTLTLDLSESATPPNYPVSASDTGAIDATESAAGFAMTGAADTLGLALGESAVLFSGYQVNDVLSFTASEVLWLTTYIGTAQKFAADIATLDVSESPSFGGYPPQTIVVRVWDPITQTWSEPFDSVVGGGVSGDLIGLLLHDYATFGLTTVVSPTAQGTAHDVLSLVATDSPRTTAIRQIDDTGSLDTSEATDIFKQEVRLASDELSLVLSEAITSQGAAYLNDPLVIGMVETSVSLFSRTSLSDSLQLLLSEATRGEIKGFVTATDALGLGMSELVEAAPYSLVLGYILGTVDIRPALDVGAEIVPTLDVTAQLNA